jgi:hypothetical protein
LFAWSDTSEEGNVYTNNYVHRERVFWMLAEALAPLRTWVARPLDVALFADAVYAPVHAAGDGSVTIERLVPWSSDLQVSEKYVLDASLPIRQPVSRAELDGLGRIRHLTTWSDPVPVGGETLRPRVTQLVEFLDGTSQGRRKTVTLTVHRAQQLEPSEDLPAWTSTAEQVWNVWR